MMSRDEYWVGNGFVLNGVLWEVTPTGQTVGGPLETAPTSDVPPLTPVSKIEGGETDGEEVSQIQNTVIMKHRGRPRLSIGVSRTTLWRRQKELQGRLNLV